MSKFKIEKGVRGLLASSSTYRLKIDRCHLALMSEQRQELCRDALLRFAVSQELNFKHTTSCLSVGPSRSRSALNPTIFPRSNLQEGRTWSGRPTFFAGPVYLVTAAWDIS